MTDVWDTVRYVCGPAAGIRGSITRWASRGLISCVDQGVASGASFAANVVLARWLPAPEYGAFAVAFSIFLFASLFHNALLVEPACVLGPARFGNDLAGYFKKLAWLHGAWSVVASLAVAAAGMAMRDASLRRAFWGLAISLPFLLLLWLLRRCCYVKGGPVSAFVSSAAYAPVLIGGLFLLRYWARPSPFGAFLVMAAAAAVASATAWRELGLDRGWREIRTSECLELSRAHWQYGKWLSATSLLTFGLTQLQTFLIAAYQGLAAAGAFRALFNFVQPVNQVIAAVALLFLPNLSADYGAGRSGRLRYKGALITAGLLGVSVAYEGVLLGFGPRLEKIVYGGRFQAYDWLIPLLGLMPIIVAVAAGRSLVLQAVQKPQHYLIRGAVAGPIGVASALIFTAWAGLAGAAASMVFNLMVSALVTFLLYRRFGPVGVESRT
jgi:O-antigen/teichoic acid export membrane protein